MSAECAEQLGGIPALDDVLTVEFLPQCFDLIAAVRNTDLSRQGFLAGRTVVGVVKDKRRESAVFFLVRLPQQQLAHRSLSLKRLDIDLSTQNLTRWQRVRSRIFVEERNFSIDEAKAADEAFITSASAFVMPVVQVDGVDIGSGKPGKVATRLREIYLDEMRKAAV